MRLLLLLFLTVLFSRVYAQHVIPCSNSKGLFEYYIRISGISGRQDVESLQNILGRKSDVCSFMANRYPVRFFLMRSTKKIGTAEFRQWIGRTYKLDYYGEGKNSREQAILIYQKTRSAR